jgi:hypothetical protein
MVDATELTEGDLVDGGWFVPVGDDDDDDDAAVQDDVVQAVRSIGGARAARRLATGDGKLHKGTVALRRRKPPFEEPDSH